MTEPTQPGGRHAATGDADERPGTAGAPETTRPLPVLGPGTPNRYATEPPYDDPPPDPARRARRFWASRRVPAALTALVALGATGLLLYDVAAVRAGRHAMRWRVVLAEQLASRPLDDVWVLTGAAVAAALGLWLVVLALSPGLRQVLPLRPGPGRVRAGLDREAAALMLRDRALEVPGVRSVRVSVGRRRARVRADSHFRELEDVRDDMAEALEETGRGFRLERDLRLTVAVRRARKG
jgi:hypothetical protein